MPVNFTNLSKPALSRLSRIRSEAKAALARAEAEENEHLHSAGLELASDDNAFSFQPFEPQEYRKACKQFEIRRLRTRQELAGVFLSEYVGVLLMAGNDASVLAGAMHTDVRAACLLELTTLKGDLKDSIKSSVLHDGAARCWREAERVQNMPKLPVHPQSADAEIRYAEVFENAAFRLNQIRASVRADLARTKEDLGEDRRSLIADLQGEPQAFALDRLTEFDNEARELCLQIRQELAAALVANYTDIFVMLGNHPASIAHALQGELRQICAGEAKALEIDQTESVFDAIIHAQAAHCWALAEEEESRLFELVDNNGKRSVENDSDLDRSQAQVLGAPTFTIPAGTDFDYWAERNEICSAHVPKIAISFGVERQKLICDLMGELFDSFASRRVTLVHTRDDISAFDQEQRTYFSMVVMPTLPKFRIDDSEQEAIDLTIAGRKRHWLGEAIKRFQGKRPLTGLPPAPSEQIRVIESDKSDGNPKRSALAGTATTNKGRNAGRRPDAEANRNVATIIQTFGSEWKLHLGAICEVLDERNVPLPGSKKWKAKGCTDWTDVLSEDPEGLVKALQHRLKWVSENPAD